jgi:hypothetical protein
VTFTPSIDVAGITLATHAGWFWELLEVFTVEQENRSVKTGDQ